MKQYNAIDALLDYSDTSRDFSREVSCFALPEKGIISVTTNNSAGGVEFDWFSIKDKIWKANGIEPEVAYMLHTHPPGYNRMSGIDKNMVHGWCLALGIPIWFLVITEEEIAYYICSINSEKKVDRDLVDISKHEDAYMELRVIAELMYGLSKAKTMNNDIMGSVFNQVQTSTISWNSIHEWNTTREWNQLTYMES
jgi:hypothetical protein